MGDAAKRLSSTPLCSSLCWLPPFVLRYDEEQQQKREEEDEGVYGDDGEAYYDEDEGPYDGRYE